MKSYRIVADEVPFQHAEKEKIFQTFFAISDYYKKHPNPGACHLISSIFYVLLSEQNIKSDLCIGEVTAGKHHFFDHSWVQIDGKVFDIAIQLTLDKTIHPPVFADYDLGTEAKADRIYGAVSQTGLDNVAQQVLTTDFVIYLNGYGGFREGAWKIIKAIGKELRVKINVRDTPNKYVGTERKLITSLS